MSIVLLVIGFAAQGMHGLPVDAWSAKYRNWTYTWPASSSSGFVIPPKPPFPGGEDCQLVDCAVAWEASPGDGPANATGIYRMFYTFFNGSGYRTCLATSPDLLHWDYSPGIVYSWSNVPGAFDYGGVTFGGPHFTSVNIDAPRTLRRVGGRYHVLYGSYPDRTGYETGAGAEGIATSGDGVVWSRLSTAPIVSTADSAPWESSCVYQPFLVDYNGTMYDFYNARGSTEQSGLAMLDARLFPGINFVANASMWYRDESSPLLRNGPAGSYDAAMASDPKVYFDSTLGDKGAWVMFYFGGLRDGHAVIMVAFSLDLLTWEKCATPLYLAGGHPMGIDKQHAHKVSVIYKDGVGYMFYTAVGSAGRGIALLTSKPVRVA